ncbi:hypothetical protein [Oceanobacillus salinisoli]|uniref:hypothetical protein n=1 Tax=Oceanobacillus salinisoli TaxID=2678611 RepID=UPI0012E1E24F|nr:hypothetical protein [Oceanobacillus salinisoli]
MKNLSYSVILVLTLILSACSGTEANNENEEKNAQQNTEENREEKQEVIIDLNTIGSLTKEEIHSKYGEPSTTENTTFDSAEAPTEKYENGLEIMYINGNPARITFTPQEEVKIDEKSKLAKMVGFDEIKPDFENEFTNRWEGIGGYYELSAHADNGKVTFFYLITNEKYK